MAGLLRRAARGRARSSLPRREWTALTPCLGSPYRIGLRSLLQAARDGELLAQEVEALGVSTVLTVEMALAARVSGHEGSERGFCSLLRRQIFTGDAAGVADAAVRFNERAARVAADTGLGARAPLLAAVGN